VDPPPPSADRCSSGRQGFHLAGEGVVCVSEQYADLLVCLAQVRLKDAAAGTAADLAAKASGKATFQGDAVETSAEVEDKATRSLHATYGSGSVAVEAAIARGVDSCVAGFRERLKLPQLADTSATAKSAECGRDCTECVREGERAVCLACSASVKDLHVANDRLSLAPGKPGLNIFCDGMPPDADVVITADGAVQPDFTNEYGQHPGDSNGGVNWYVTLDMYHDTGDGGPNVTTRWRRTNINEPWAAAHLEATANTGPAGRIHGSVGFSDGCRS